MVDQKFGPNVLLKFLSLILSFRPKLKLSENVDLT